jgi:two-component system sensor histidine kinase PhoQ
VLSLNARVLIAASAVLSSFFGLAGVMLDRAYEDSVHDALIERLQGHIYALIAAAGMDETGRRLAMPVSLPDQRFSDIHSGLFAQVTSNDGVWEWQSQSVDGLSIPFSQGLPRLESLAREVLLPDGRELYLYSYGVVWSDADAADPSQAYTFSVAKDMADLDEQVAAFRRSLWGSLGGVALMLLAVQGTILRWGLAPLRRAEEELAAIETGRQPRLQGTYPPELRGLTGNINALLSHQQEHLERYRRTLGDLAHSLKTPLAVLRSASDNPHDSDELRSVVQEQVERMNQLTGYQLQRAATSGWSVLTAPVDVRAIAEKVLAGLSKVYADKQVQAELVAGAGAEFHADEGDLMEIIGNLVDNAFKWCSQRVRIRTETRTDRSRGETDLFIHVEDDGLGIAPDMVRYVMQRGRRADSDIAGHGIGLSIVRDIVQLYGGSLEIGVSQLGGAAIHVWLPARPKDFARLSAE